jgi:hypothetical protein
MADAHTVCDFGGMDDMEKERPIRPNIEILNDKRP